MIEPSNPKQAAWEEALTIFGKSDINMLETGRIRNPNWKLTDGDSSNYLTQRSIIKRLYSIDNDSENFSGYSTSELYCRNTMNGLQLEKIEFINGHSVDCIRNLNVKIDVALLDSANDSNLIYDEFIQVLDKVSDTSLIIIDDTTHPGVKGDRVIDMLDEIGIDYVKKDANPSDCIYFFLDSDKISRIKEYDNK